MSPPREELQARDVTLSDVRHWIRQSWRSCFIAGLIGFAVGVALWILKPKSYSADASFVPEQPKLPSLPSGLGALAAQFGLDALGDQGRSPQFYRQLLGTSALMRSLLDSSVHLTPAETTTVRGVFSRTIDTSPRGTDRVLRRMRNRIGASADGRTSIVSLSVRAPTPQSAEEIAELLIHAVQRFNVSTRQTQARERRLFLEQRTAETNDSLRRAENTLRAFYERNRRFSESPTLVFEESRMRRRIELQEGLFTTLMKELETSRIQEVNETPTITIVDPPFAKRRPAGPSLRMLGAMFAIAAALGRALWLLARARW